MRRRRTARATRVRLERHRTALRLERLEPRLLLSTTPLITEFMASNDQTLLDGDGNSSDWIEIHNPTTSAFDLSGWHLTDDATDLNKWTFPDLPQSDLAPGEHLVVFASGQPTETYVDPGGFLHTDFKLSAGGEYLALTDSSESIIQEFSPEFPSQETDVSYGLGQEGTTLLAVGSGASYLVPTDDSLGSTWTGTVFDDSLWTNAFMPPAPSFVITELGLGSPDSIEIQNVGSQSIDTTGWVVAFNDSSGSGSVNSTESFVWDISGNHPANTILDTPELVNGLGNISWDDDSPGWAMILDDTGEVVDFVAWGYTASEIGTFNVAANGFDITSDDLPWTGDGIALVDNVFQILREGNQDNNDASDFVFSAVSNQGVQNPNLVTPFANSPVIPATTGIGFQRFDTSHTGNNGIGSPGLTIDNDVPPGAIAGTQSYDTSAGLINTQAIDLLDNSLIAAAGGFTYDVWVKASVNPPARGKIVDYAGTENLRVNSSGFVEFTVSDGGSTLSNGASISDGQWHHLIAEFDSTGNTVQPNGSISGTMRLSVDGAQFSQAGTVSDFGDSLNRSIGVGAHPFGSEHFPGLLHDVKVSLGVASGTLTPVFEYLAPASGSGMVIQDISAQVSFAPSLVMTDIENDMQGQNASLYLRQSFDVADPVSVAGLTLRMQYDDGFIAYLNGTVVASSNAPVSPVFDSSATADRTGVEANSFETFDISQHNELLQAGENILAIHGLNSDANDDDFLISSEITATLEGDASLRFFFTPTPGAANNEGGLGFVDDTRFSVDRGFFDSSFQLAVTTDTADAEIYYTTDGSEPSSTNGFLYSNEITIDATTTIRARAFKDGFEPTNIDTQTYLFLDAIFLQSPNGQSPAGWPAGSVNGQVFDYGIDPNVVNDPTWAPQLAAAFSQIPSLSLVTNIDNLTDPTTGIYVNAQQDGPAWERPTSLELINPDGSPGFQVEAGLRIRGGFSRGDFNPKHSFRLFFRSEYGDSKLNFPLFGEEGVDRFDNVDLRTAQNYAWSNSTFNDETRNTFLRDIFSRDLQGAQGQEAYTRGEYYHLYINGQYWGMYQTEERPNANFAESYFGGSDEDYDAVKASGGISATDGDLAAWTTLSNLANAGFSTDAAYYFVQGKNSDGTDNATLEEHVDVDNLIDFMINVYYTGNEDMPTNLGNSGPNNFWAIRPRDGSIGWQWIAHDNEHNLGVRNHNVSVDVTSLTSAGGSPSSFNPKYLHQQLTAHPEYLQRFADRVQALLFNDGPMTVTRAQSLLDTRIAEIDSAIIAESARWGDQHNEPPLTKSTW
ncbi:MAG: CotH kinase family protein, partial [Bythopirellula sp.]